MKDGDLKIVKELTDQLFSLLGISSTVDIKNIAEDMLNINVNSSEEKGLLIGSGGENIFAFQTILSLMIKNKLNRWIRLSFNVGDYNQKQEDRLKNLADQTVARVLDTGQEQPIYNLNAQQRRVIHLYLSENKNVETESVGEGVGRYLLVRPKK